MSEKLSLCPFLHFSTPLWILQPLGPLDLLYPQLKEAIYPCLSSLSSLLWCYGLETSCSKLDNWKVLLISFSSFRDHCPSLPHAQHLHICYFIYSIWTFICLERKNKSGCYPSWLEIKIMNVIFFSYSTM